MGLSLMPTPASVFAVRHKELSMLIHCSAQPQNKSAWVAATARVPSKCVSQRHTHALSKNGQVVTLHLGFLAKRSPFVRIIPVRCLSLSLSLTCSYLPAAGERLSRSLAGFSSETSTANCQTGFLGVDADKPFCPLRQSRPESVWLWSDSSFVML